MKTKIGVKTTVICSMAVAFAILGQQAGMGGEGVPQGGGSAQKHTSDPSQFLPGDRAVLGKVQSVAADQIKVDIGEVQPRFIPLKPAKEKQLDPIKPGDLIVLVLSDQNLIVDYHHAESRHSHHQVIAGRIAQDLSIGHDRVIIDRNDGRQESHEIQSQARSKVASIPVGAAALFLIDETNQVADATFADEKTAQQAARSQKSPLKNAQQRIDGTVAQPLKDNRITIRKQDGAEERFEVRPLVHDKAAGLSPGEAVVLLLDPSNKVLDVAIPPQSNTNSRTHETK